MPPGKPKVKPRPRPRPRKRPVPDSVAEAFEQSVEARDQEEPTPPDSMSLRDRETVSSQEHAQPPVVRRARGKGTRAAPRVRANDGVEVRSTTVHIPSELHRRWRDYAHETDQRMSTVVEAALREFLGSRRS